MTGYIFIIGNGHAIPYDPYPPAILKHVWELHKRPGTVQTRFDVAMLLGYQCAMTAGRIAGRIDRLTYWSEKHKQRGYKASSLNLN